MVHNSEVSFLKQLEHQVICFSCGCFNFKKIYPNLTGPVRYIIKSNIFIMFLKMVLLGL